ncbi:trichohyalin [Drosophila mauritiana]|uniref:Trichohyalin n=1 Tax=Drosophila mauritiana TaxID=7226 RepID=A0A6P8KAT7_DROMA|nr:trichohyalin [Drosophila mauritiana]
MTNARKEDEIKRDKRKRLDDLLGRSYRQKVRIIRGLTVRQASDADLDLCAKWLNVFRRATKEERWAKDYLVELILRQLQKTGHLSLPFTNLANCRLDLRLLLDDEGRQRLRRFSSRQVVAPKPSSNSMAMRVLKSSSFEWRRRLRHLDHLEDQFRREEQEVWSQQQPPARGLVPEPPAPPPPPPPTTRKVCRSRKRVKTIGVQAGVPVITPRAERDLCERDQKQREILKRRERDRVQRQLREQDRKRQRTLLAEQQRLDRQSLEKARQVRDRRLREQQQKVKEQRDHERHLLLKRREEQRLWSQRRPTTPSSQDVEIQQRASLEPQKNARHDHEHDPRYLPQTAMTVPVDSDSTQSARRIQQLHLRAENIRRKLLAYEELKKYHRERATAERERLDRKEYPDTETDSRKQKHEKSRNPQINVTERKRLNQKAQIERETDQREESKEKRENNRNRIRKRQESEEFEQKEGPITAESDHKEEFCGRRQVDEREKDKIDRRNQKNMEKLERERQREAKILKERQEREEFERNILEKFEAEQRKREEFDRNRQEELLILKERQEKEEFERRELEKKLEADRKQKEELERLQEEELRLRDKEFEKKILEKLEADRKIREEFERQRQEELKNLRERQEKEESERKELEKKLEAKQKQMEDLKKLREEDLKCLKSLQSKEALEAERKEREAFERKTCKECEREKKKIEELERKSKDLQEGDVNGELDKREQEEYERFAREEESNEEKRLLENLRRSKEEIEARERKIIEDDLQREQILRKWLQKQEQKENREREEREKRERKIKEGITAESNKRREREQAERKHREKLDRLERERQEIKRPNKKRPKKVQVDGHNADGKGDEEELVTRRCPESPNQEEIYRDLRMQEITLSEKTELKLQCEARKVAKRLQRHLLGSLGVHGERVRHLGKENDPQRVASERKAKSQTDNWSVENPPADMTKMGLSGNDVSNVRRSGQQLDRDRYENANVRLKKVQERNSTFFEEVKEKFQELDKLRLKAGELEAQNPLNKRFEIRPSKARPSKKDAQKPISSSQEYFQPGSLHRLSERWCDEEPGAEDPATQGRNGAILSSSESDTVPEPRYSLEGKYCPFLKTYAVETQNAQFIPHEESAQGGAYGAHVPNQVDDWRKTPPSSYSTEEAEPGEERARGGGNPSGIRMTYCTRTGKKRFPQIKQSEIGHDSSGLKEDRVQQRRVFGQLLKQARSFDCSPEILRAENRLLEKKLARAKNKYLKWSVLRMSKYLISVFQNDEAIESSEEENESLESGELEQIYVQETDSNMLVPRPIFKTLIFTLVTSNESISPHLADKITELEDELKAHLKKISRRAFAQRGAGALKRKAKYLMDQQRQLQSRQLSEVCRNSEEQTSRMWGQLASSSDSLRGIRYLFRDCCDLRDPFLCVALQNIERLYKEWKDQRFDEDWKQI